MRDIRLFVFHRLNVILSISRIVSTKINNPSLGLQLGRFESVVLTARFARVYPLWYVLWAAVKWGYEKGHYVSSPLQGVMTPFQPRIPTLFHRGVKSGIY